MSTGITTNEETTISTGGRKVFFKVVEGSNYKVLMTYEFEQVIEFEHFQKLAKALFSGDGDFVTINDMIVQKRDIKMVMPTTDPTPAQKLEREAKERAKQDLDRERDDLVRAVNTHRTEYLNQKLGVGNWSMREVMLNAELLQEIARDFDTEFPGLAKRRDELIQTS